MSYVSSSVKEWHEKEDKKSPGLARLKEETFKVGNRVDVLHDGEWVVGTIIAKRLNGSKFDIIYDDGDEENNVDPLFMRFEMEGSRQDELETRSRQVKVLSDENIELTIKYNKLKEEHEKVARILTGAKDSIEIIKTLKQSIAKLEKEVQPCKELKEEIEELKQENLTYVRLIKELSTAQRASIKGGRKRKTKRNQNGPAIFSADF